MKSKKLMKISLVKNNMDDKRTEFKELLDKTIVKNYDSVNSYENQIQNLRSFVHNIIPEKLYRYRKYNQDTIKDLKTFIDTH